MDADGTTGPAAGTGPDAPVLPAAARLAEIPGISPDLAATIIAETGLEITRFPTAGATSASWSGYARPRTSPAPASGLERRSYGNAYLRGALGQAALGAARTGTFLGERYRRVARRRGKAKAQVAVARSILTIIWHLLADPAARYTDLGPDYVASRTDRDKKIRNHVRQLQALGLQVTLTRPPSPYRPDQARRPNQPRVRCRAPYPGELFSGQRRDLSGPEHVPAGQSSVRTSHTPSAAMALTCTTPANCISRTPIST